MKKGIGGAVHPTEGTAIQIEPESIVRMLITSEF